MQQPPEALLTVECSGRRAPSRPSRAQGTGVPLSRGMELARPHSAKAPHGSSHGGQDVALAHDHKRAVVRARELGARVARVQHLGARLHIWASRSCRRRPRARCPPPPPVQCPQFRVLARQMAAGVLHLLGTCCNSCFFKIICSPWLHPPLSICSRCWARKTLT